MKTRLRRKMFRVYQVRRSTILVAIELFLSILAIRANRSFPRTGKTLESFDSIEKSASNESTIGPRGGNDSFGSKESSVEETKEFEESWCNSTLAERNDSWTLKSVRVPLCCSQASRLSNGRCSATNGTYFRFPALYRADDFTLLLDSSNRNCFDPFTRYPCKDRQSYNLNPDKYPEDAFMLLDNGSIYKETENAILEDTEYCFGIVDSDTYLVVLCFEEDSSGELSEDPTEMTLVGLIVSIPFLFLTFLVYTIVPELNNMHGRTLRGYIGSLLVAYTILAIVQLSPQEQISDPLCIAFAFVIHFSFLASFFWLNVMCFDIWWTFGGFRSLQGSVKQRERKKFVIYSVYAWGCAFLLTGVCVIMDFLPDIPDHFVKPEFGVQSCWFNTDKAKAIYFYGPMGVTVFCNICLFVSTALKIVRHKKDTAHHLKGSDSRRHDDNKQWFNLYLKLFIVMGINWSMEIVSWLCNNSPTYIWYLTDLTNTLQGVIIFLIFVWKEKIRRLLLKRLGCHGNNVLSRNSTRSAYHSSASRTTCTTSAAPLHEKIMPCSNDPVSRNSTAFVGNNDSI